MTKEEAKYFSDVLKAYSEGKEIEVKNGDGEWGSPLMDELWFTGNPMCYRVKPEPKYRPYRNAEEFLKAQKEHGPYIKCGDEYLFMDRVQRDRVLWRNFSCPKDGHYKYYPQLYAEYRWQDGHPCGIVEEQ